MQILPRVGGEGGGGRGIILSKRIGVGHDHVQCVELHVLCIYSQYTHAGVECLVSYFFFFSLASLIYIPIVIKRKELRNVEISFKFK